MRLGRAFTAGLAGAVAYLAAQELDRRLGNPRSNDMVLLGGLVTGRRSAWVPLGTVLHLLAGASFGLLFEAVVAPRLRGPYWWRGIVMAQAENAALWPLVLVLDRTHPAVASGALARMNRPAYVAQAVWRHLALGAVLGLVLGEPPARPAATAAAPSDAAAAPDGTAATPDAAESTPRPAPAPRRSAAR